MSGSFRDVGLGLTTGGPCMIEDTGFIGSEITGGLASGELRSGRVPGRPSPRIGDGEDDVDDEANTVGDIFCEKKELLGSEDSFLLR